jgi:hypothetical protein
MGFSFSAFRAARPPRPSRAPASQVRLEAASSLYRNFRSHLSLQRSRPEAYVRRHPADATRPQFASSRCCGHCLVAKTANRAPGISIPSRESIPPSRRYRFAGLHFPERRDFCPDARGLRAPGGQHGVSIDCVSAYPCAVAAYDQALALLWHVPSLASRTLVRVLATRRERP